MRRILLAAALLAACAKGDPTGPQAGKAYFTQQGCASCHRVGDEGSAVGPDLTLVGFRHSREWLELFIKDPQAWKKDSLMPNRRMSDASIKAIAAYLAEQQGQAWPEGKRPWEAASLKDDAVARGRVLFIRAGCVGCHGPEGRGGYPNSNVKGGLIPSLEKAYEGYSKAELLAKIKAGVVPEKADPAGPAPMIRMPPWGEKLSPAELDAVASYVLSLGSGRKSDAGF